LSIWSGIILCFEEEKIKKVGWNFLASDTDCSDGVASGDWKYLRDDFSHAALKRYKFEFSVRICSLAGWII